MKTKTLKIMIISFAAIIIVGMGCKKTLTEIVNELVNGIFDLPGGWQVEVENNNAYYVTKGTTERSVKVGDDFFRLTPRKEDGTSTFRGYVRDEKGFGLLVFGSVEFKEDKISIMPDVGVSYSISRGTKTGNSGGGGGGTGSPVEVIVDKVIEGKNQDKITVTFNVPTGVKSMTVKTTEEGAATWNTADLFVRKGATPTVTLNPSYSWVADCAGVQPNRSDEVCKFTNPGSGSWTIMLYGYNSRFNTKLLVSIVR